MPYLNWILRENINFYLRVFISIGMTSSFVRGEIHDVILLSMFCREYDITHEKGDLNRCFVLPHDFYHFHPRRRYHNHFFGNSTSIACFNKTSQK